MNLTNKINKLIIFALIGLLFISCHKNSETKEVRVPYSDSLKCIKDIHQFYLVRSEYIQKPPKDSLALKNLETKLNQAWDNIMYNKEKTISLLIKYHSPISSTSFSLYGKDYPPSLAKYGLLPDNLHALYLVESIIRNDYLFNKRHYVYLGYLPNIEKIHCFDCVNTYFISDRFCFIIDTTEQKAVPKNRYTDCFDISDNNKYIDTAWALYLKWYKDVYLNDVNTCVSALEETTLRWNLFSYYGGANHSNIGKRFYMQPKDILNLERGLIYIYPPLGIKIGKGNLNCSLKK